MNSFLAKERPAPEQVAPYLRIAELQEEAFHEVYAQGMKDGTLDPSVPEETMFSVVFHMMLAAATRYAVGLVYLSHRGSDPEAELVLLENMILKEFSTGTATDCR